MEWNGRAPIRLVQRAMRALEGPKLLEAWSKSDPPRKLGIGTPSAIRNDTRKIKF